MSPEHTTVGNRRGATLIELLTVLAILSIMVAIAAPSLHGMLRVSGSELAGNQLTADLAFARMLSVRSGRSVSLVFTDSAAYHVREGVGPASELRRRVNLTDDYGPVRLLRSPGTDSVVFTPHGSVSLGAGTIAVFAEDDFRGQTLRISPLGIVLRE